MSWYRQRRKLVVEMLKMLFQMSESRVARDVVEGRVVCRTKPERDPVRSPRERW